MTESLRLRGKVALITGAGRRRGLGEAIGRRFAEQGAHVVLSDIAAAAGPLLPVEHIGTKDEMESVAAGIRAHLGGGSGVGEVVTDICDVRSESDVMRAIGNTVARFGRLDIVVNNAGVGYIAKPLMDVQAEEWDLVLDVNLRGAFLFIKHAAIQMVRQRRDHAAFQGRIINIASKAAKSATPRYGAYAASKHGLIGLTRVAATELGEYGITVNAVCPNHVTTALGARQNEMRGAASGQTVDEILSIRRQDIPMRRIGVADDTANACLFLASDEASYITGEAMNVSGGEEMH